MPSVRSLSEVICYNKKRLQILLMHGGVIMRRFHCAALAAVAVLGFTSVASAADMPVKAPAPIVAPLYNWTGPYIGIAGGYGWGHSDQTDPGRPPNAGNGSYSLTGGILGGTLGYNWQQGPWVLGSLALKATIRGPISAAVPIRADWPLLSLPIPAAARLNPLAPCVGALATPWALLAIGSPM